MISTQVEVKVKQVTVKEIYEAIEMNGFDHLRGHWMDIDAEGKVQGGCVLAQGAINLGVMASFNETQYSSHPLIQGHSLAEQLDTLTVPEDSKWIPREGLGMENKVGSTIIYWNDHLEYDEKTFENKYTLPTYEDVTKMAHDLLEPYFDKKLNLAVREYFFR